MIYEEFHQDIYNNDISIDTGSSSVSFMILSVIEQVLFELLSRKNCCKHPNIFDILASSNKQTLIPDKDEVISGSKTHLLNRQEVIKPRIVKLKLNLLLSLQVINPSWFPLLNPDLCEVAPSSFLAPISTAYPLHWLTTKYWLPSKQIKKVK